MGGDMETSISGEEDVLPTFAFQTQLSDDAEEDKHLLGRTRSVGQKNESDKASGVVDDGYLLNDAPWEPFEERSRDTGGRYTGRSTGRSTGRYNSDQLERVSFKRVNGGSQQSRGSVQQTGDDASARTSLPTIPGASSSRDTGDSVFHSFSDLQPNFNEAIAMLSPPTAEEELFPELMPSRQVSGSSQKGVRSGRYGREGTGSSSNGGVVASGARIDNPQSTETRKRRLPAKGVAGKIAFASSPGRFEVSSARSSADPNRFRASNPLSGANLMAPRSLTMNDLPEVDLGADSGADSGSDVDVEAGSKANSPTTDHVMLSPQAPTGPKLSDSFVRQNFH